MVEAVRNFLQGLRYDWGIIKGNLAKDIVRRDKGSGEQEPMALILKKRGAEAITQIQITVQFESPGSKV